MNRRMSRACLAALEQTFGVNDYRPGQKAAASCLLSGRDLLCILPTGAGKSLCWQLPAVVRGGLTVVVTPLIALMHDQVAGLKRRGIPAAEINSLMPAEARQNAEEQIRSGAVRIVFVSPERLETEAFQRLCRDCPPWLLVVDEAHCVVQWGAEFRPAYSHIGSFIRSLADRPVLCVMTATADVPMQRQIVTSLGMAFHRRVMLPVLRDNLTYRVITATGRTRQILRLVQENGCRTVIFCRKRQRTEQLAELLRNAGFRTEHYHAGLDREARQAVQDRFRSGQTEILAATTAFGMGIDIPDIRRVILDGLPGCVTDLVQQSGRAGRDGEPSECIVLMGLNDFFRSREIYRGKRHALARQPLRRFLVMRKEWQPYRALMQVLLTDRCVTAGIAASFGQRTEPCGRCSACLHGPLADRVPELPVVGETDLRLWLLRMQRDALARRRGVSSASILSEEALRMTARTLSLPPMADEEARLAMNRLVTAMRGGPSPHGDGVNGKK